jgi:serine/threonine protein phosphatase 1
MSTKTYYAIGDVHGMTGKLSALHAAVLEVHSADGGPAVLVHLGDYIDRGPDSRGVLELVRGLQAAPPEGLEVVALRGNHEQMMLDAYDQAHSGAERTWMENGGRETVASYALRTGGPSAPDWMHAVDVDHIHWIRGLPTLLHDEAQRLAFVHAGIDPVTFPRCDDTMRLWSRQAKFFETERWPGRPQLRGLLVVHGHTPTEDFRPYASDRRINIDTGAVYGGPLTALALTPGQPPRFISVR